MTNVLDPRLRGIYVITDSRLCAKQGLLESVGAALAGGARLVQYRDKSDDHARRLVEARQLVELCETYRALLLINDDVRLARAAGAHGVHLGRDDMNPERARQLLDHDAIIGISCYDDFDLAHAAARTGANYVAFGSVFPSPTKPGAVRAPLSLFDRARRGLEVPTCAIGGINHDNISEVTRAGAAMVAVVSSVFAAEDVVKETRQLVDAFNATKSHPFAR